MVVQKICTFLFCLICFSGFAQTSRIIKVKMDRPVNGMDIPVGIDLDEPSLRNTKTLQLNLQSGKEKTPVPIQISEGKRRILNWKIPAGDKNEYIFELSESKSTEFKPVEAIKNDSTITMTANGKNLLRYYHATVNPPTGQDINYRRSGFIHPVWTPKGQELTRIQAPDHYHHYGIWNPWTHVEFEKDTVDFWNIKGKQGTVRFAKLISKSEGPVFSEFQVLHEHVVFKKDGTEKVALNEIQTVRVFQPENDDYYIADITSSMSCASESPFRILTYRYAGMGWRTTGFWNDQNCEVLTSEGKTRKDTDGTRAKWCIVQGELPDNQYGGIAFLSYPSNYNFPEPMRIWNPGTNGRGDMFFNFAPTKDRDWLLEPGKTYVLKYRMIVFSGKFDAAKAESAWQYFQMEPQIEITK
jgi:hypothetical protein